MCNFCIYTLEILSITSKGSTVSLLFILSGDTLGSFVYVPCEVIKLRMQVQGTSSSWNSVIMKDSISMKRSSQIYGYYRGMFHAGRSICRVQGIRGLYAG